MVQLEYTEPVIKQVMSTDGDSFTVPSGEVWKGTFTLDSTGAGSKSIQINGANIMEFGNSAEIFDHSAPVVLVGGQTINYETSSGEGASFTGHRVDQTIDNTVVAELLSSDGASVTVPTGEVWHTHVFVWNGGGSNHLRVDNVDVLGLNVSDQSYVHAEMVFSGGDTLEYDTNDSGGAVYISGFVVN